MLRRTLTVFAVLAAVIALPTAAETTLEDILATHIESKGGMKAIEAIESLRYEGKMVMGPGMEAQMTMEVTRSGQLRAEIEIQGMTIIQAFDGEVGWGVNPLAGQTGPVQVTGPELENLKDQADLDGPFIGYEERGETLEFVGTEELDGMQVHRIKLTKKNGEEATHFLDVERCLEVKSRSTTSTQGMDIVFEATYGDYKEVAGVTMWHSLHAIAEGAPASQAITYDKILANTDIAADRFSMPAPAPAAAPEADKPAEPATEE